MLSKVECGNTQCQLANADFYGDCDLLEFNGWWQTIHDPNYPSIAWMWAVKDKKWTLSPWVDQTPSGYISINESWAAEILKHICNIFVCMFSRWYLHLLFTHSHQKYTQRIKRTLFLFQWRHYLVPWLWIYHFGTLFFFLANIDCLIIQTIQSNKALTTRMTQGPQTCQKRRENRWQHISHKGLNKSITRI